jgi:RND family efflux transporter MFP subunit
MVKIYNMVFIVLFLVSFYAIAGAQENKQQEMPAAQVVVSEVTSGLIAPETEFIGTVYYQEVSDVAAEVDGMVEKVHFEEGQKVKKKDMLVKLSSDLLEKKLQATRASYEQVLSDLEKARRDLKRAETLFEEELISEQLYDDRRFNVNGLEKKSLSVKAEVESLEIELTKKVINAPYYGVVIKRHVDRGEWVDPGTPVATIAKNNVIDIVAEVPEQVIKALKQGIEVNVMAGGQEITGKIFSIIPRGDISTRTVPVKVRVKNRFSLIEGMEARVVLPVEKQQKTLTVQRDAVISVFGTLAVFAVIDAKAKMVPVRVIGYKGLTAGVSAEGLSEGMKIVVKGNERLMDGQPVQIIQ